MQETTILIIEDDADIREGIRILLKSEQRNVLEAENGKAGLELLSDETDLVILDIMMPGMSGLKTCEEIRKRSYVPILFLTAKADESDKLIALMAGGDDYLTKPFSYAELLGRVQALLRRYRVYNEPEGAPESQLESSLIETGRICLNEEYNEVSVDGRDVDLTTIEYQILRLLMQNPGKIFSAQNLYESIWNEPFFYQSNSTIMVHIRKLRVKIESDPADPQHIKTVWGKGYRFE